MILTLVFMLGVLLALYLIYRHEKMYKYRICLISKIYAKEIRDFDNGIPRDMGPKIYAYLDNEASYNKMLLRFWVPLKDEYWLTQEQIKWIYED